MKKLVFFAICCLFISVGIYASDSVAVVPVTAKIRLGNTVENKKIELPSEMKFNKILKNGDVGEQLDKVVINLDKLIEKNNKNMRYTLVSDDYNLDAIENKNLWKELSTEDSVNILYTSEGKLVEAKDLGVEENEMFKTNVKVEDSKFVLNFKGNIKNSSNYAMRGNLYIKINDPIY